ncbi:MAG: hypothetical protein G5703_08900 [Serratia symbiotica]|nr:hypothetical protein [Serratia symbiotica]
MLGSDYVLKAKILPEEATKSLGNMTVAQKLELKGIAQPGNENDGFDRRLPGENPPLISHCSPCLCCLNLNPGWRGIDEN